MPTPLPAIAAIEFGGTKTLVTATQGDAPPHPPVRIPTTTPEATLAAVIQALTRLSAITGPYAAIGVASFGPIALNPAAANYGELLNTPKPGWSGANILNPLTQAFAVPIALETDVNAAAIGEAAHAAAGCTDYAYITVGTGIGVAIIANNRPLHGVAHPEAGHLLIRRRNGDPYKGNCPSHHDCAEGLFSGPALQARLSTPLTTVPANHEIWDLAGDYLAQLCMAIILMTAPARIVVGGGVGARPELQTAARTHLSRHLGGYLARYRTPADLSTVIVPAALKHSGLIGALTLADHLRRSPTPSAAGS